MELCPKICSAIVAPPRLLAKQNIQKNHTFIPPSRMAKTYRFGVENGISQSRRLIRFETVTERQFNQFQLMWHEKQRKPPQK